MLRGQAGEEVTDRTHNSDDPGSNVWLQEAELLDSAVCRIAAGSPSCVTAIRTPGRQLLGVDDLGCILLARAELDTAAHH